MRPKSLRAVKDQPGDLEAGQLRALLEHLSSALANPSSAGKAWNAQSVQGQTRILDGLRAVVDAVHRRDPLVSDPPAARDPRLAPTISRLTTQLRDTYLAWLGARLDSRKMAVLRSLLSHPVPDLLDILGKTDEENAHSDVIRWLLDPREARVIAPATLHALVERLFQPKEWQEWHTLISDAVRRHTLSVRRECVIPTEEANELRSGEDRPSDQRS